MFFAEADTEKHRYALAEALTFADCRGGFRALSLVLCLQDIGKMIESVVTVMTKLQHKRSQICIHHSTISEIAIQQHSLKYNCACKIAARYKSTYKLLAIVS